MAKMRNFKFTDGKDFNEIVEALSFKKAVKSVQNKIVLKNNQGLFCELITKKGKEIKSWVKMPLGRKKKLSR